MDRFTVRLRPLDDKADPATIEVAATDQMHALSVAMKKARADGLHGPWAATARRVARS